MSLLQLERVSKAYRSPKGQSVHALDQVSLELQSGEFVAIMGPSGCGKSTLLMIAGTLLSPDAGRVSFDASEPYRLSPDERARFRASRIGFVFQQFHLIPYLSILDNVLAASLPANHSNNGAVRLRAEELLKEIGLWERRDHRPQQLSSGERQRCALSRALINRPKLLLADEPTGNLDAQNASVVLTAIRSFADNGGAVLLVTHDVQAAKQADRLLSMTAGKIENQAGF